MLCFKKYLAYSVYEDDHEGSASNLPLDPIMKTVHDDNGIEKQEKLAGTLDTLRMMRTTSFLFTVTI